MKFADFHNTKLAEASKTRNPTRDYLRNNPVSPDQMAKPVNQMSQPVIPQDQIAKAWTQNKSKAQMFIKNVPVAIMPTSKLPPNSVDSVKQEAGKRDQTSYSPEKFANGLAAIQAPKQGKGEIYIFDQSSMANYGPYSSQITPALSEYLQQLGIDSAIAKLYIKKVPTPFIPASVFGIEGKRIQTSWGDQAVDSGAFITQEANGHTYCCNPDSQGLPIGYIPAQQGVAEASNTMQRYGQLILKRAKAKREAEAREKAEQEKAEQEKANKEKKPGVAEGYWADAVKEIEKASKERAGKPFEKNPASHDKNGVYLGDKDLAGNPVPKHKEPGVVEAKADPLGAWIAHKNGTDARKFKTREGAKKYVASHEGFTVSSSEAFHDTYRKKKVQEVKKFRTTYGWAGGSKEPRSAHAKQVAAKRKEYEKGLGKFEPTDNMVGTAKVTKGVAEGLETLPNITSLVEIPAFTKTGTSKVVITGDGRITVVVKFRGVNVPFYISTGEGGKLSVPTGMWYPFFGSGPSGYLNKGTEDSINKFYGSKTFGSYARFLNRELGNLMTVQKQIPPMKKEGRSIINKDMSPMEHAEIKANPEEFKKRVNAFLAKIGDKPFYTVNTAKQTDTQGVAEGWKDLAVGGAMALGALGAGHAQAADLSNFNTQYLQQVASGEHPRPMVSIDDAKAELQARANGKQQSVTTPAKSEEPKGFSKEYLQKAADPNRFGRYMISIEKAQELLNNMKEGVAEGRVDSPVSSAITRRILTQRHDLLKFGPQAVMDAVDQVAEWVGEVEEIGSSDVSAWVAQVARYLQTQDGQGVAEGEKWIQKAVNPNTKGDLHNALHVPQDETIPKSRIAQAIHSTDPHLRHMAQFAKNVAKEDAGGMGTGSVATSMGAGNGFANGGPGTITRRRK